MYCSHCSRKELNVLTSKEKKKTFITEEKTFVTVKHSQSLIMDRLFLTANNFWLVFLTPKDDSVEEYSLALFFIELVAQKLKLNNRLRLLERWTTLSTG